MDDRAFFDKLAPTWDANEVLSTPERINNILNFVNIKSGSAVLDLGTGTGVLLPYIAERVGEEGNITAVDYSTEMLKRAQDKYENLVPKPSFLNLDFENETIEGEYDNIMLYCVYPHLHTPVDTLKWLLKVNLKDDGVISMAFPCNEKIINNIHKEKHSESDRLPSAHELAKYFREEGLKAEVMAASDDCYLINIRK